MGQEPISKVSIIISKGSLEGVYPGLIMANGARAEGMEANVFFTFFGLDAIHKQRSRHIKVASVGNPGLHLPTWLGAIPGVSGLLTKYMERQIAKLDIPSIPEFVGMIADTGAGLYACQASVDMFGLSKEDFVEQVEEVITVGEFYDKAAGGQIVFHMSAKTDTVSVDVYADIVCPFAHLSLQRFAATRAQRRAEVVLRVRAWPLEWINGEPLTAAHASLEVEALRTQVAPDLYVGFDEGAFPTTSIPAFGLASAAYARDDPTGEAVSLALRVAVFERGLDIGQDSVLDRIAATFGLERPDPRAAAAAIRADWCAGRERGVRGSPHFFVNHQSVFCPLLSIARHGDRFDVRVAEDSMREFYGVVLG